MKTHRNDPVVCPEPKRPCVRCSEELLKSTEVLNEKGKGEIDGNTFEELRKTFRKGVQKCIEEAQQLMERTIQAEKAKLEAEAAAERNWERQQLQDKTEKLHETQRRAVILCCCIQHIRGERDKLKKDYKGTLKDKENAEAAGAALRKELAKEQDKSICQICFTAPRDAIVLPCRHFQYCHECLQKYKKWSKECPTCRGKMNGIIQCNLT